MSRRLASLSKIYGAVLFTHRDDLAQQRAAISRFKLAIAGDDEFIDELGILTTNIDAESILEECAGSATLNGYASALESAARRACVGPHVAPTKQAAKRKDIYG